MSGVLAALLAVAAVCVGSLRPATPRALEELSELSELSDRSDPSDPGAAMERPHRRAVRLPGTSLTPAAAGLGALGLASGVLVLPTHAVVVALIAIVAAVPAWKLVEGRRRAVLAERRAGQVVFACEAIAGDLSVGLPPRWALERVERQWAGFGPVATAARLDADVPQALRDLARLPGAGQLTVVAAAWQVAHRSGAGLADSLHDVATVLREDAALARLVAAELAAARVTARMMCALPVAVLLLAAGVGARPWHFLTATPVGLACLAGGAVLDLLGLIWMQRIADGVLGR